MPQSLSKVYVHLVFSTKHRQKLIPDSIREELHGYIGGIMEKLSGTLLKAGSVEDHIHLLIVSPRTASVAEVVESIKTGSTKWMKLQLSELSTFHWQNGYGAFSISPSERKAVENYIASQREHHQKETFEEEYRSLLREHGIEFDERYMWD